MTTLNSRKKSPYAPDSPAMFLRKRVVLRSLLWSVLWTGAGAIPIWVLLSWPNPSPIFYFLSGVFAVVSTIAALFAIDAFGTLMQILSEEKRNRL